MNTIRDVIKGQMPTTTSFRRGVRALAFASVIAVFGATQAACEPGPGGPLQVTDYEDILGLSSRIVFSATKVPVEPRFVTLRNTGTTPINVTDIKLGGAQPGQFKLAANQAKAFTIAPGATAQVGARFTPSGPGVKFASMTIVNNSPTPNYVVSLSGVLSRGTLGNTEPQLAQLVSLFGYTTNVGFTGTYQAIDRKPVGDEVVAPYWVRADSSQPVQVIPIARYVQAYTEIVDNGRNPKGVFQKQSLYKFPPDEYADPVTGDGLDESIYTENQKIFPKPDQGTTSFSPTDPFGLYLNKSHFTDDQFNRSVDDPTQTFRNVRAYPALGPGRVQVPNTWILGVDVKTDPSKNFDFQDQVVLVKNARPEYGPAVTAGGPETVLPFTSPMAGTIADKDGQGTGFQGVQVNKAGTQYKPSLIDLTGGTVRLTSTAGRNTGADNTQDNALQVAFDGSRNDSVVQTRLLGPMTDLSSGYQQKAVYYGPDQDNYAKIEIEHRIDKNGVFITFLREQKGGSATLGQVKVASPATVSTLDLSLVTDLETGGIRARYRINSDGAWTNLGGTFFPTEVMRFFHPQARAGILVSNTQTTTPVTGVYDSFSVVPF
jgi:hypothetical protein